jgi:hypothetical protein
VAATLLSVMLTSRGRRASDALSKDRVEAAKALVMLDLAVFKADLETGMFKKPDEVMAKEFQYDPLPPEVRITVTEAWVRGGMVPKALIEQMIPAIGSTLKIADHQAEQTASLEGR